MSKPIQLKVAGGEKGLELIALLARRLGLTRNEAKRRIDSRQVFINHQRVWMARHQVQIGDLVEIHGMMTPEVEKPCEILWQDDHFIIINKPAGWLANGTGSIEEKLGRELQRTVHAVHRLDRETSGCMLLAWSRDDMQRMIPVFQRREVKKLYEGLVIGNLPESLEVINRPVDGEDAMTLVKVMKRKGPAARLEFTLITGRTHQIRRHLTALGLHLAGEKQYGATTLDNPMLRTLKRHMLHAVLLGFPHPYTQTFVQARAAIPEDFKQAAKALGL